MLAGLATYHKDFPLTERDRLLQQCELMLNLLRNARLNPKLSAWTFLSGNHNFNKVPLLPLRTRVVAHIKTPKRVLWGYHGVPYWYVGPAINHYWYLGIYTSETHKERITETLEVIPEVIPIPNAPIESHLRNTTKTWSNISERHHTFSNNL